MKDRKMKGLNPQPEHVFDYTSIVKLDDLQYDLYTSARYFKVNGIGEVVAKTLEELEAQTQADTNEANRYAAKVARDEALANITVEINGKSVQARPSDELNLRLKIAALAPLESTKWILSNNTRGTLTREELEQVYVAGLTIGADIYDTYNDTLEEG
jgi:hypothetical protein